MNQDMPPPKLKVGDRVACYPVWEASRPVEGRVIEVFVMGEQPVWTYRVQITKPRNLGQQLWVGSDLTVKPWAEYGLEVIIKEGL